MVIIHCELMSCQRSAAEMKAKPSKWGSGCADVPGKRRRYHHECAWERTQTGTWAQGMKFLQHQVQRTTREKRVGGQR